MNTYYLNRYRYMYMYRYRYMYIHDVYTYMCVGMAACSSMYSATHVHVFI